VLGAFLGDHGTVIFQNRLLKNTTFCPAMSIMYGFKERAFIIV
jgi:hypothetical protein